MMRVRKLAEKATEAALSEVKKCNWIKAAKLLALSRRCCLVMDALGRGVKRIDGRVE